MTEVHCRKCWQPIPLLTKRCGRCGDLDAARFGRGIAKIFLVAAAGVIISGLVLWIAYRTFA